MITKWGATSNEVKHIIIMYEIFSNVKLNDPTAFFWSTIEYFSFDPYTKYNVRSYDYVFYYDLINFPK